MRRIAAAAVLSIILVAAVYLFIGWGRRAYEFFWHRNDHAGQVDGTPSPPLNASEKEVITRIFLKALAEPLSETDLGEYKQIASEYSARTGRAIPENDIDFFLAVMRFTTDYNRELGRCLLVSIDQKSPFVSPELDSLRSRVKAVGSIRSEKLEADYREIESVAYARNWTDESGHQVEPLTKKDILETLKHVDVQDQNFKKMAEVMREIAKKKTAANP